MFWRNKPKKPQEEILQKPQKEISDDERIEKTQKETLEKPQKETFEKPQQEKRVYQGLYKIEGKVLLPGEQGLDSDIIVERRISRWKIDIKVKGYSRSNKLLKHSSEAKVLDLSSLDLKKLPESVRRLQDLEVLDLENNLLDELPEWIGELEGLKAINLTNNRLQGMPQQIVNLQRLAAIYLDNNSLTSLPSSLLNLPINDISLNANPRLNLPESVLQRPANEILRYYFESRDDGMPLLELKLLLVGRGKAGKTTLVKRLAGEQPDRHEPETHSISIREFLLDCSKGKVRTRAWDFGGQEILHSTHQFFLTERSLYLLTLEPRTGLAQRDAEYWLKLIEMQGGGSPVIVALNWSHGRNWRVDEVKLRRKFPFIIDFISIDALHGDGIQELSQIITKTVQESMPDVWLPFPRHWRQIKNDVASMSGNFLTYNEYTNLCNKYNENRPDAQSDLAGILHALGLALYFGKDPRLHDTRVLNPSWVTGGVYAVIRSNYVKNNDGQLASWEMPNVLKEAEDQKVIITGDYPLDSHRFILELMRAFQLCYASEAENGKPTIYLVPELLPEFEPAMEEEWEKAPVRLRYRYNILPPGFLPRFIVQTHPLSEDAPHWRHGVVLKHADALALIREESDRSELHVFVLGNDDETRGVLVAIVRRELELLHAAMKMQPTEELELTGDNEQWISVKALQEFEQFDKPRQKLPVQPEGTAEVNIPLELDKLIPSEVRAIDRDLAIMPEPIRVFVSYAHDDEQRLKRLDCMLAILEQQHGLASWRDRKRLIAGDEWNNEIHHRLEEMDIFLFIASQKSLVQPYIRDTELRRAKERKEANEIEILTVKLEPCACDEDAFLGKFQRLGSNFKSIAESREKSLSWELVRKDILPVIERVRQKKAKK
jgi:internalin A